MTENARGRAGETRQLGERLAHAIRDALHADDTTSISLTEARWVAKRVIADLDIEEVMTGRTGVYEDEGGRRVIGESDVWGRRLRVFAIDLSGPTRDENETGGGA